jgi:hypothetical protein
VRLQREAPSAGDAEKAWRFRAGSFLLALLGAAVCLLSLGGGTASAITYTAGTPASFCTGTGVGAGECGELKGLAVDQSTGDVYVLDQGNNRVDQFASNGSFVRAFGTGVADGVTTAAQTCTATCFKGLTTGAGAIGTGKGVAVDSATHVVYAASAASRVAYFNGTTGSFIGQTEGNGNQGGSPSPPNIDAGAPEAFSNGTSVAIDSSDPLQRYLYVATKAGVTFKIDKLKISAAGVTAGSYVCQITGTATASSVNNTECGGNGLGTHKDGIFSVLDFGSGAANAQPGGHITVDENGNVFVAEKIGPEVSGAPDRHYISEYDKTGNFVTQFKPCCGSPTLSINEPRPVAVATLRSGNVLVAAGGASATAGGTRVQEYSSGAPGAPLLEFGLGTIGGSTGIATFGPHVYVSDRVNKKIWKFSAAPEAPTVTTEAATALTKFKATLHGRVNPNQANVTDCHFDYGTTVAYGSTIPCAQSPGGGFDSVVVSADLSGLIGGTTYHFRLAATNSVGTTNGGDLEFTTPLLNKPEVGTSPGATEILQTSAKVAGTVNPNEILVTDCHFNYGTTVAYGQTAPCVPSPGSGENPVPVTASLSGLSPATTYHFQLEATNGDGTSKGSDQQFKTLPDPPSISDVTAEVGQIAAQVSANVNPNSGLVSDCRVEYGLTTSYGSQKTCSPAPGEGAVAVAVKASLTGLAPSTLYHYRMVATNSGGTSNGVDHTFITLPPNLPGVFNDGASAGLGNTYTMEGRVDPEGLAVSDCHFSYGPSSEYGKIAPCTPSAAELGTGDSEIAVTAATEALEPNTTYHFRLFASNLRGTWQGKDRTFTTGPAVADECPNAAIRAAQGIEVMRLPDCLALEQVSPSKKGNQSARIVPEGGGIVTADGGRVLFNSTATLGDCATVNAIGGDVFVGGRVPGSAWSVACTNPPVGQNAVGLPGFSFTPDLSGWIQITRSTVGETGQTVRQEGLGKPSTALSPPLSNLTNPAAIEFPAVVGASADHARVYVRPGEADGSFLPGDPTPAGPGAAPNLYLAQLDSGEEPSLELAAEDRDAKVWGGNCGARLGDGDRNQGAISRDGSRAYLSTRPSQPASGNCEAGSKKRIVVRQETPTGPTIEELFQPECTRVAPVCTTTDGDDSYQGASVDQRRVYFTSSRQLTNADLDGGAASCSDSTAVAGCDLYLYDANRPAGERLVDVSAGDSSAATPGIGASVRDGITAISADGSHVYFVARTVLSTDPNPEGAVAQGAADNLYLYTYPEEELQFVGTLAAADGGSLFGGGENWNNGAYAVPIVGTDGEGNEIGGDGRVLLLNTKAPLTAGDADGSTDLYRYDSVAGTLVRVSEGAPGGADSGTFGMVVPFARKGGTDYAEKGRWVSEDGSTVVFTSKDALFPGDANGAEDSYLWREGQLYHLPGSTRASAQAREIRPIISHDGTTIAYHSTKRLTFSDIDTVEDVYVLRSGGGFPVPPPSPNCEGEACQGVPSELSSEIGAITGSLVSPGNVTEQAAPFKCPKGKRKVRRGGKVRCVRRVIHKKHAKKRTGAKHGGQK